MKKATEEDEVEDRGRNRGVSQEQSLPLRLHQHLQVVEGMGDDEIDITTSYIQYMVVSISALFIIKSRCLLLSRFEALAQMENHGHERYKYILSRCSYSIILLPYLRYLRYLFLGGGWLLSRFHARL